MKTLKFSKENNDKLKNIKEWSPIENPRVYSFSLLSGFSCPKALDCQTYAIKDKVTGKRKVVDGKHSEFRCFSAIQEAQYPSVYNQRKHNFDTLLEHKDIIEDVIEPYLMQRGLVQRTARGRILSKKGLEHIKP